MITDISLTGSEHCQFCILHVDHARLHSVQRAWTGCTVERTTLVTYAVGSNRTDRVPQIRTASHSYYTVLSAIRCRNNGRVSAKHTSLAAKQQVAYCLQSKVAAGIIYFRFTYGTAVHSLG